MDFDYQKYITHPDKYEYWCSLAKYMRQNNPFGLKIRGNNKLLSFDNVIKSLKMSIEKYKELSGDFNIEINHLPAKQSLVDRAKREMWDDDTGVNPKDFNMSLSYELTPKNEVRTYYEQMKMIHYMITQPYRKIFTRTSWFDPKLYKDTETPLTFDELSKNRMNIRKELMDNLSATEKTTIADPLNIPDSFVEATERCFYGFNDPLGEKVNLLGQYALVRELDIRSMYDYETVDIEKYFACTSWLDDGQLYRNVWDDELGNLDDQIHLELLTYRTSINECDRGYFEGWEYLGFDNWISLQMRIAAELRLPYQFIINEDDDGIDYFISKEQWQGKVKDYNRQYGHILKAKYLSDGVIRLDTKVNGGWQKLYSDWLIGKSPIFVRDDLSAKVYQEFEELREKNIYLPREITNSLLDTDYPISSH